MKKLSLIICCLFVVSVFAQNSNSTISITNSDTEYNLNASFSYIIDEDIREDFIEELGKRNMKDTKEGLTWKSEENGKVVYFFRIAEKRCSIFLNKELLTREEYEDYYDFSEGVEEDLNDQKEDEEEEKEEDDNSFTFNFDSDDDDEEENSIFKPSFEIDMTINGRKVEMDVKDKENYYSLEAKHIKHKSDEIIEKIKSVLEADAPSKKGDSMMWEENINGETGYKFIVSKKECIIFIDRTVLSNDMYEKTYDLGKDISKLILMN